MTLKGEPCRVRKGRQLENESWICHIHDPHGNYQISLTEVQKLRQENRKLRVLVASTTSSSCSRLQELQSAGGSSVHKTFDGVVPDVPGQMIFSDLSNGTELFTKPDDEQAKAIVRRIRIFRKWEEEQNV